MQKEMPSYRPRTPPPAYEAAAQTSRYPPLPDQPATATATTSTSQSAGIEKLIINAKPAKLGKIWKYVNICHTIEQVYVHHLNTDLSCTPLSSSLYDYFLKQYGLVPVAETRLWDFLHSLLHYTDSSLRVQLFVYVAEITPPFAPLPVVSLFSRALKAIQLALGPSEDATGNTIVGKNEKEKEKRLEVQPDEPILLPFKICKRVADELFVQRAEGGKRQEGSALLNGIMKKLTGLIVKKKEETFVDRDELLHLLVQYSALSRHNYLPRLQSIFSDYDIMHKGWLSFHEFVYAMHASAPWFSALELLYLFHKGMEEQEDPSTFRIRSEVFLTLGYRYNILQSAAHNMDEEDGEHENEEALPEQALGAMHALLSTNVHTAHLTRHRLPVPMRIVPLSTSTLQSRDSAAAESKAAKASAKARAHRLEEAHKPPPPRLSSRLSLKLFMRIWPLLLPLMLEQMEALEHWGIQHVGDAQKEEEELAKSRAVKEAQSKATVVLVSTDIQLNTTTISTLEPENEAKATPHLTPSVSSIGTASAPSPPPERPSLEPLYQILTNIIVAKERAMALLDTVAHRERMEKAKQAVQEQRPSLLLPASPLSVTAGTATPNKLTVDVSTAAAATTISPLSPYAAMPPSLLASPRSPRSPVPPTPNSSNPALFTFHARTASLTQVAHSEVAEDEEVDENLESWRREWGMLIGRGVRQRATAVASPTSPSADPAPRKKSVRRAISGAQTDPQQLMLQERTAARRQQSLKIVPTGLSPLALYCWHTLHEMADMIQELLLKHAVLVRTHGSSRPSTPPPHLYNTSGRNSASTSAQASSSNTPHTRSGKALGGTGVSTTSRPVSARSSTTSAVKNG